MYSVRLNAKHFAPSQHFLLNLRIFTEDTFQMHLSSQITKKNVTYICNTQKI